MNKLKVMKNKSQKTIALSQIALMFISVLAFAWMIGGSFGVVSSDDYCTPSSSTSVYFLTTENQCIAHCKDGGYQWYGWKDGAGGADCRCYNCEGWTGWNSPPSTTSGQTTSGSNSGGEVTYSVCSNSFTGGECRSPSEGGFTFSSGGNKGNICTLSNGDKGTVRDGFCGDGNEYRCCVPTSTSSSTGIAKCSSTVTGKTPILSSGADCGNGGSCVSVQVNSQTGCANNNGKLVLDPNKATSLCPQGTSFLGYGLCGIPELNGDGTTTICCSKTASEAVATNAEKPDAGEGGLEPATLLGDFGKKALFGLIDPNEDKNQSALSGGEKFLGSLFAGVAQGVISALLIEWAVPALGGGSGMKSALQTAVGFGFPAGQIAANYFGWGAGVGIGAGAAALAFMLTYHEEMQKVRTYESLPWEPPLGGEHCRECNDFFWGCSEYQCKSLGKGCELVNSGTEDEACVWINQDDVVPPELMPWDAALPNNEDYQYTPAETVSLPDKGVKIVYSGNDVEKDECVKPFFPLSFGITTDEPASCKIDMQNKFGYDNMSFFMGGNNLLLQNHSQVLNLPGPESADDLIIKDGETMEFFVRCADANGNVNENNFVFQFCVDLGPDTIPPVIVSTDPNNGMPVAFDVENLTVNVYTNEPADCKWDRFDREYDDMNYEMTSLEAEGLGAQMVYNHEAELSAIDEGETKFYFRCRDQPTAALEDRNTNQESYEYTLVGTEALEIKRISPAGNETLKESTYPVEVEIVVDTIAGFEDGKSNCEYSLTGDEGDYEQFVGDTSFENFLHTQPLWFEDGKQTVYVKCIDLGGNVAYGNTTFEVEVDNQAPLIIRARHQEGYMMVVTNEEAECVYDTVECDFKFEDGLKMRSPPEADYHFADWNTNVDYYVKCMDVYGNKPLQSECSIIVKAADFEAEETSSEE